MKRLYTLALTLAAIAFSTIAIAQNPATLPRKIESGPYKAGHIQGIAVDAEQKYIYYSYTTMLIKTDMQGNIVGTVTGLLGHLGDLGFNNEDGRLYGSLEYKNDAIGQGILRMEKSSRKLQNAFYIAIFDVDKITREGMDAEKDGIMTTVYLPTVLDDYLAEVQTAEGKKEHRLGCSGIDGVTFGPKFGKRGGKQYLTVGYGVYGDTERSDNDYQVLLQYDVRKWQKYERALSQDDMHQQGPAKPAGQYFVKTGNTTYGVQNLDYDAASHSWMMAVYKGNKKSFPNYTFFAADGAARPVTKALDGVPYIKKAKVVALKAAGKQQGEIRGWDWGVGSTGMCSLGEGYFYLSHNYKIEAGQGSIIRLYRFTGNEKQAFESVE
ncbi:MAG: hypothetical protein E7142_07995 [Rikenellaceae bacterium]|nr:hypothetical protein [Rikenellaceae bacterium]